MSLLFRWLVALFFFCVSVSLSLSYLFLPLFHHPYFGCVSAVSLLAFSYKITVHKSNRMNLRLCFYSFTSETVGFSGNLYDFYAGNCVELSFPLLSFEARQRQNIVLIISLDALNCAENVALYAMLCTDSSLNTYAFITRNDRRYHTILSPSFVFHTLTLRMQNMHFQCIPCA